MNKFLILAFMLIGVSTNSFAQKSNKEINREYSEKYREIGTDPTLSGYEKGQRKRELSLKKKQEILDNKSKYQGRDNSYHHDSDYKDKAKEKIEDRIDKLENRYDKEKDRIDDNNNLSKNEKKAQKEALKKEKDNIK